MYVTYQLFNIFYHPWITSLMNNTSKTDCGKEAVTRIKCLHSVDHKEALGYIHVARLEQSKVSISS